MERREWTISQRAVAYLVCDGIVNADKYYPQEIAEWARDLMVGEARVGIELVRGAIDEPVNQHAVLVEQRDRLLRLLRPVTSPTACYCAVMEDEKCWHCEARELIAAVEQADESQAKGGSGSGD